SCNLLRYLPLPLRLLHRHRRSRSDVGARLRRRRRFRPPVHAGGALPLDPPVEVVVPVSEYREAGAEPPHQPGHHRQRHHPQHHPDHRPDRAAPAVRSRGLRVRRRRLLTERKRH
ncbi:unnamed protein product, partial [Musa acuminata subsp. burmannicoides]